MYKEEIEICRQIIIAADNLTIKGKENAINVIGICNAAARLAKMLEDKEDKK